MDVRNTPSPARTAPAAASAAGPTSESNYQPCDHPVPETPEGVSGRQTTGDLEPGLSLADSRLCRHARSRADLQDQLDAIADIVSPEEEEEEEEDDDEAG